MSPKASIGVNLRVTGHCSQGGRKYMEDFFSIAYQQSEDEKDLEYAFFGIYDGHGGSEAATYAKEHLMNSIVNQKLFWSDCDQDILRAIREGYIATHYAMWREQEKWPKTATGLPSTAGTTASVAFIRRGKIYIGHVGDSGIVLGYQEEGDKRWKAKPLTHDHKPECNVEKARIINSGGKVVTKSGVPRVVWNRPRIGHKGPVRRSTPIDEIPFLAVARSLGDLWSYNSALNEFVVSPDPDVRVVKIDPKTYRCLIFGTDGLWNVLSPTDAVDLARDAEIINEKLAYMGGGASEWTNPSKCLVDKALERWCARKMRADNTSVVTIMLDPPGPPKKEMIRNCSATSYGLEYIQLNGLNGTLSNEYVDNSLMQSFPVLDNSTVAAMYDQSMLGGTSSDSYTMPTNGYAIMTSYENDDGDANMNTNKAIVGSEIDIREYHTYHSLDESGIIGQDHVLHHTPQSIHQQQQHQYQQQCMSAEDGYSLTKLETRCEQQFRQLDYKDFSDQEGSSNPSPTDNSVSPFQEFSTESTQFNQYNNITSSYQQTMVALDSDRSNNKPVSDTVIQQNTKEYEEFEDGIDDEDRKFYEPNLELRTELEKEYEFANNGNSLKEELMKNNSDNRLLLDESIQINEISSSVIEPIMLCVEESDGKLEYSSDIEMKSCETNECDIKKTPKTRRSTKAFYQNQTIKNISNNKTKSSKGQKLTVIEQNENISILEPRKLRSTVNCNKRNLRSRDTLSKDMKAKPTNSYRKQQTQQQTQPQIKRNLNNYLKVSNSSTTSNTSSRSRQLQVQLQQEQHQKQQQITVWSPRQQKRSKNSPIVRRTAADSSLRSNSNLRNKPKISSDVGNLISSTSSPSSSSSSSSVSSSSSLIVSSSTILLSSLPSSKRSTTSRNSACCSGNSNNNNNNNNKSAVQTRNRVQKRLSH